MFTAFSSVYRITCKRQKIYSYLCEPFVVTLTTDYATCNHMSFLYGIVLREE